MIPISGKWVRQTRRFPHHTESLTSFSRPALATRANARSATEANPKKAIVIMKFLSSKMTRAVLAAALLASTFAAQAAREVAGVKFEDQVTLANQPLVLSGVGLRTKMIIKVYALGLYAPQKATSTSALLSQSGPKSVRIVLLRTVKAEQLSESLLDGIKDNTSSQELDKLQSRVDVLNSNMLKIGEAQRGATIQMDYLPSVGTRITMGGKQIVPDIAGEDFYRALLKIWLGDSPADKTLKKELLSGQ